MRLHEYGVGFAAVVLVAALAFSALARAIACCFAGAFCAAWLWWLALGALATEQNEATRILIVASTSGATALYAIMCGAILRFAILHKDT